MLHKEFVHVNADGEEVYKCGFKIGGGIDLDYTKSPQGYTDNVSSYFACWFMELICKLFRLHGRWTIFWVGVR